MGDRTYVFTQNELWEWRQRRLGWPYSIRNIYQGERGLIFVVDIWEQIADEESLEEIRIWRIRHGNR